jgi:hypothetical protein
MVITAADTGGGRFGELIALENRNLILGTVYTVSRTTKAKGLPAI